MFDKTVKTLQNSVIELQTKLDTQVNLFNKAKESQHKAETQVKETITKIHEIYGLEGLKEMIEVINTFISEQSSTATAPAAEVIEPVIEPAPDSWMHETLPGGAVAPFTGDTAEEVKAEPEVEEVEAEEVEVEKVEVEKVEVEEVKEPEAEGWLWFDTHRWLEERNHTLTKSRISICEEKLLVLLRDGWTYTEINQGLLGEEGDDISPAIGYQDGKIDRRFRYEWFSRLERSIVDKMFAAAYGVPVNEIPRYEKVLFVIERLTGLLNTPDSALKKSGVLTPKGLMMALSHSIVGISYKDGSNRKQKVRMGEWKEYLSFLEILTPEETAYLEKL